MTVMAMPVNGLLLAAPDCGSWGLPARGTSLRSVINVHGRVGLQWIQNASCMVARMLRLYVMVQIVQQFQMQRVVKNMFKVMQN